MRRHTPRADGSKTTGMRESSQQRRSYGIVCFDKTGKKVLCVRKKFTYAITALVTGSYVDTPEKIKELFNELTESERLLLREFSYDNLLNRIFHEGGGNITPDAKNQMSRNFNRRWKSDTIIKALQDCDGEPGSLLWEIPKGHHDRRKDASRRDSAIREFMEETRLNIDDFTMCDVTPFTDSHTDSGVTYITQYWFAQQKEESTHKLQIDYGQDSKHYLEVSAISWLNLDELKIRQCKKYFERSIVLFKKFIKHYHMHCSREYRKLVEGAKFSKSPPTKGMRVYRGQ